MLKASSLEFLPHPAMAQSTIAVSGSAQANWRGIKLSPQQETELNQYCLSKAGGIAYGKQGKHFWVDISKACPVLIGRPYSWQSCRRSALAWEGKNEPTAGQHDDSVLTHDSDPRQVERPNTSELVSDASRTTAKSQNGPQTPHPEDETSENGDEARGDEYNEDDMLPEQPTSLPNRTPKELDPGMSEPKISTMAASWLANWESEVKNITGILEENQNPVHQKRILRAFSKLQNEMQASIQRYNDRTGGNS